jgi:hypothetical protein
VVSEEEGREGAVKSARLMGLNSRLCEIIWARKYAE